MKRYTLTGMLVLSVIGTAVVWFTQVERAGAHCQVPCGIYDDKARIQRMYEDTTTIAKAIGQIRELAGKHDALALNQITRWVTTKEAHASHIIEVVSEYFLTQKVKPLSAGAEGYDAYLASLADHHAVMVAAMKTKQNPDPALADALHHAIERLAKHYE
jgi:nickel superoxide dismutase